MQNNTAINLKTELIDSCDTIAKLVSEYYPHCGIVVSAEFHNDNAISSNQHYLIITTYSKYFLKVIDNADALFQNDGIFRIETVSESIYQLRNADLYLESIIINKDGIFVTINENKIYRLYKYIYGRAFNNTLADIQQAAKSQSRFHQIAHKLVSRDTHTKLKKLKVPYSLVQSIKNIDKIEQSVNKLAYTSVQYKNTFKLLSDEFKFIREGIRLIAELKKQKEAPCLVHLDFHQNNVIYSDNGIANIIDLDNAMLDEPSKCVAFSILRFSLHNQPNNPYKKIIEVAEIWIDYYNNYNTPIIFQHILYWMMYIELEKIIRIVTRYTTTGKYSNFLDNIERLHLPNLKLLINSEHD